MWNDHRIVFEALQIQPRDAPGGQLFDLVSAARALISRGRAGRVPPLDHLRRPETCDGLGRLFDPGPVGTIVDNPCRAVIFRSADRAAADKTVWTEKGQAIPNQMIPN
jgi:hypothetical protein